MTQETAARGALGPAALADQMSTGPQYRASDATPALQHSAAVRQLWGGELRPIMSAASTTGRHAGAALSCPPTACTGMLRLPAGAISAAWRNRDAIENLVALDGEVEVRCGSALELVISLGRFDLLSIPANVRHQVRNVGGGDVRLVSVLSIGNGGHYGAAFDTRDAEGVGTTARQALGLQFDDSPGDAVEAATLAARTTRFAALVPYKKDLKATAGIPPEATEMLSAGSVYPLIVPEGHIGRSRTAPMYGNQGLYMSIAECAPGDDGPPPHAHSDTQESFFVLDGRWDISSGFDNEHVVQAVPGDIVAMPPRVMRAFRNTDKDTARLLVIIQGPERMHDTVSFSQRIGEVVERRFGKDTIAAYEKIRMTFDAEQRLGA